ncbi:unnamed protein product [Lactuca virosa]|uniref:GRAM domain-containing protein n=1 Tax=Lactuca virosa TaxID=75947 RepID=A0AAU9P0X3_9ASTR|nr:unnamed protein product [Lactuca virosa]
MDPNESSNSNPTQQPVNESSNSNPTQQPVNESSDSNPTQPPVKPDDSHSGDNAPNPKQDDLPPSNLPSSDNFASVAIVPEKQPEVPPASEQPSQTTASTPSQGPSAISGGSAITAPEASNPYVTAAPVRESSTKNSMDSVRVLFRRWAKKAADATKKGQEYAGDMWQHLKTGPSVTDAAVGRIAQGTKRLLKSYACYLSTSAGPVIGVLYLSTAKFAFCSDNPLPYKVGEEKKWSYYKVVIPLLQLKTVRPSRSKTNAAEKYIQVISIDNHEFWFMGFVNYDSAVKHLEGALQPHEYPLAIGSSI